MIKYLSVFVFVIFCNQAFALFENAAELSAKKLYKSVVKNDLNGVAKHTTDDGYRVFTDENIVKGIQEEVAKNKKIKFDSRLVSNWEDGSHEFRKYNVNVYVKSKKAINVLRTLEALCEIKREFRCRASGMGGVHDYTPDIDCGWEFNEYCAINR